MLRAAVRRLQLAGDVLLFEALWPLWLAMLSPPVPRVAPRHGFAISSWHLNLAKAAARFDGVRELQRKLKAAGTML
jgi:hypothetical protein